MKKLFFVITVMMLGAGFMACEQEEVSPLHDEPTQEYTVDDDDEEEGGVKGGN